MIKILAIDDDKFNLISLKTIINDSFPGSILYTALDGTQGIELAIANDPDMILLDIFMPDMDGFEVCRHLKMDERVNDIPVAFITSMQGDKENRIKVLETGAEAFLSKPIDATELTVQIKAMLKIKLANRQQRDEKERLTMLVVERTRELEQSQIKTLDLLNDLKVENEVRKKIEEELRESELHFRTLADSGQALIWTSGVDKKCNYFNQIWLNFTGRTLEQEMGDGWNQNVHPDDLQHCVSIYTTAFDSREKFSMEYRIRHFTGEYRWIQDDGTPRYNSKNEFIGYIGHCLDISERKRSEEVLKESEAKFRTLFTQMSEGFALHEVIYDSANKAIDYKIIDINPAFEKQVGIKTEKAIGRLASELYEVSPVPYLDIYAQVAETGDSQFFQTYFPPLDRHFEISVFSPKSGYFATVFSDITERKTAEEVLIENENRLQELNAAKDKFFSIISHDLRSPFNVIIGFSEILEEQVQKKNNEEISRYATIIKHSSLRAMDLLMNLLEWSRSQTGRMDFSPENIEIATVINEAAILLNDTAIQKNITIYTEYTPNVKVFADKAMIDTILRNLISNAIKFTNPGDEIVISAEQKKNELLVTVSDNGIGIKKEAIEKLFRIDTSYSTKGTQNEMGTSLGLILCKEFVEKHGGKIWVESEVDKGSTFSFSIPKIENH